MAENQETKSTEPHFESQRERWLKYGLNVVVVSVVVVLLAAAIVYLAQRTNRRLDTTAAGAYSLKPQTINILRENKQKLTLVSLYRQEVRNERGGMEKSPFSEPVADLLDEYRRQGRNVEVQVIDPVQNPAKVDGLITEVTNKFGSELKQYREITEGYSKTFDQIKAIAAAEAQKVQQLPVDQLPQDNESELVRAGLLYSRGLSRSLDNSTETVQRLLSEKPPDYKEAVAEIGDRADEVSARAGRVVEIFNENKDNARLPEPIRQHLAAAIPAYEQIKKLADEQSKQTQNVGELKLDELRRSLNERDTILVIGESDLRVIPFNTVWRQDEREARQIAPGQEVRPQFAGEQQVSTAILALNQDKKPKVAFVRAGGPPLTTPAPFPFRGGPLSHVAERLRDYNFEVLEKDLTGMWAMQSQMQQMPSAPEPSDEELKDAIWVVLAYPQGRQQNPMMPPPTLTPQVTEHLKNGGSALVLFDAQGDNLGEVMKEWGIEVRTDAIAVHQMIDQSSGRQGDWLEEAKRLPFIFDIREYGDHTITRPLRSLTSIFLPLLVVKPLEQAPAGVKVTPIIPIPNDPPAWGETDIQALQELSAIKFDAGTDVPQPIYGGAVAERENGGRLVVIGSPRFAYDDFATQPNVEVYRNTGRRVLQFPANGELFNNSIFWLAKMEPLIAISPAAMEVARIEPMSDTALRAWRVGALLIGLPGIVVLAGLAVYFARRD